MRIIQAYVCTYWLRCLVYCFTLTDWWYWSWEECGFSWIFRCWRGFLFRLRACKLTISKTWWLGCCKCLWLSCSCYHNTSNQDRLGPHFALRPACGVPLSDENVVCPPALVLRQYHQASLVDELAGHSNAGIDTRGGLLFAVSSEVFPTNSYQQMMILANSMGISHLNSSSTALYVYEELQICCCNTPGHVVMEDTSQTRTFKFLLSSMATKLSPKYLRTHFYRQRLHFLLNISLQLPFLNISRYAGQFALSKMSWVVSTWWHHKMRERSLSVPFHLAH